MGEPAPLPRGLIVSCQARPGNPLRDPGIMAAMARAAVAGGAVAIRAEGSADIAAVRAAVDVPVIGLLKRGRDPHRPYITPDVGAARAVAAAGADVVAVDATDRARPGGPVVEFIPAVIAATGLPVLADVATLAEGRVAAAAGATAVATTLAGYVGDEPTPEGPDLELLAALARELTIPVVAEGRYARPEELARAFGLGAHTVVVGTAITNPAAIAARFAARVPEE